MKITQAKFAMSSTSVEGKPARRLPEFAFIGRSNVGKSSLINMLCGNRRLAMTSATPGKTKLVNHFIINDNWYIVDLPGYGFARLPARERKALHDIISDYLSNSLELVMLFVLVDSRHDPQKIDVDFIGVLGEHNIPFGIVFTKGDKLGPVALQRQIDRYKQQLLLDWDTLPPCFVSSAETGLGKDEILGYIGQVLEDVREDFK